MQTLSLEQLDQVTGGGFRSATFGALSALNALGVGGQDPSNSVARALGPRPSVGRQLPSASSEGGSGGGGGPKGPFQMGPFNIQGKYADYAY